MNTCDRSRFVPLLVAGQSYGWVKRDNLHLLKEFPNVFEVTSEHVTFTSALTCLQTRSNSLDQVLLSWQGQPHIQPFMGEKYAVSQQFPKQPVCLIDRSGVAFFGVRAYGIHVNGYTFDDNGEMLMWVAKRAKNRIAYPGKLDQLVAGGIGHPYNSWQTLIKECKEEAGIEAELASQCKLVSTVRYVFETTHGVRRDSLFNYDLLLPPNYKPRSVDGEVDEFMLMSMEEVSELVATGDSFKANCNLVVIDFLLRHGFLDADQDGLLDLTAGLNPPIPAFP